MLKSAFILLTLLVCIIQQINSFEFADCGSKIGKFTRVVISGCDTTKTECILKRNTTVSITIDFALAEQVSAVNTVVHGKVMGIEIPFQLENPNACINSGLKCPLDKDETYEYTATLPVLKVYPKVSVLVKWELQDQDSEDIICLEIPARIQ